MSVYSFFDIKKYHFISDSILEGLPNEDLRILKEKMIRREEKKGKLIFREGTYSKGVYLLRKGKVKIFQTTPDGKERVVYIYTSGEPFGYRPLLCDQLQPVSAKTLEESVLSFIPRNIFLEVLSRSTILSNKLLHNLSYEFSVWINTISVFAQKPVKERVALSLLILNEKYKKKNREHLAAEISLSRDDHASFVGTTKETLVRMLRQFKDEKIIWSKGRKIKVMKPLELEKITEGC